MNIFNARVPNFLIIGAGKSGTTSLSNYLNQHPEIFISTKAEPNFFVYEGKEDASGVITSWDDYLSTYSGSTPNQKLGEASPMYLYSPEAPDCIKKHIPNVKLIAILRHPIDRLYSRHMQLVRLGQNPSNDIEEAFDKKSIWWKRPDLISEGYYSTYLKRYYERFNADNIKIFLYEDYENNPQQMYSEICDFIDVNSSFSPDFKIRMNQSGQIKNPIFDQVIGENSKLKNFVKSKFPALFNKFRSTPIAVRKLNQLRRLNLDRRDIDSQLRNKLTEYIYKDEILALQDLIGRDLSTWLNKDNL